MTESARAQDPSEIGVTQTKAVRRHTFIIEGPMGATQRLFIYKCVAGHLTEKVFPLGTRFDDHDETTCQECLLSLDVKPTYLISADAISAGERRNGKPTRP